MPKPIRVQVTARRSFTRENIHMSVCTRFHVELCLICHLTMIYYCIIVDNHLCLHLHWRCKAAGLPTFQVWIFLDPFDWLCCGWAEWLQARKQYWTLKVSKDATVAVILWGLDFTSVNKKQRLNQRCTVGGWCSHQLTRCQCLHSPCH